MNYSTLTKAELIELLKEKDKIIEKLENKTESNNVYIIKGLTAFNYKEKLDEFEKQKGVRPIYSMGLNSNTHFGNPFSPIDSLVKKDNLIKVKDTKEAVEKYIEWITNENVDEIPSALIDCALQMIKVWYFEAEKQENTTLIAENVKQILMTYKRAIVV